MTAITPRKGKPFTPDMSKRPRILVVEDDVLVAVMIKNLLEETGCDLVGPVVDLCVVVASAGAGAIEAAIIDHVRDSDDRDYIVEDFLARHGVPFGFVLGQSSVVAERHSRRPFVCKPFAVEELYELLSKLLTEPSAST